MSRGKKGLLMSGLILVTLGALLLIHRLFILNFETSWPLLLVVIGLGLFLINRRTWAGWIVGGIGVILFVVNFVIEFFPEFEAWSDLVGPIILLIIGALLLYRYYYGTRLGEQDKP
jgi:membrane-bound ClpP family serine protease